MWLKGPGGIELYRIGRTYKFEMPNAIFYTGEVVEEDGSLIRIVTVRGEELVLNKSRIVQSKRIEGGADETGGRT